MSEMEEKGEESMVHLEGSVHKIKLISIPSALLA